MDTPDLLATLERIRKDAHDTKLRIARGHAPRGSAALQRIEYEAQDAIARERERQLATKG